MTILSTLCYVQRQNTFLMLHRIKKHQDVNAGKWIGIGGKMEMGESPDECMIREAGEETGLTLQDMRMRGVLFFSQQGWPDEVIFIYTATAEGEPLDCAEGVLRWVPFDQIPSLSLWEGDRIFLPMLMDDGHPFFSMTMRYEGDRLIQAIINGTVIRGENHA